MKHEQWWEKGKCRDANPAIFDGVKIKGGRPRKDGTQRYKRDWSAARAMCEGCPVQLECFRWAMEQPTTAWDDDSFIAGFEPQEIRKFRNQKARRS